MAVLRPVQAGAELYPTYLDTLVRMVYGDAPVPDSTYRRRRCDMRDAVKQIGNLYGWKTTILSNEQVKAKRLWI